MCGEEQHVSNHVDTTDDPTPPSDGPTDAPRTLVLDGRCLTQTLRRIDSVDATALDAVRDQAAEILAGVVRAYEDGVAAGEVGEGGSARASATEVDGSCPTGLLYGRIQSGKTLAMITFTAMAVDNGFRVVVVLTTNFLELVRQTKTRFDDLARVLVTASTEKEMWEQDVENLRKHVGDRGLVVVCSKDATHLQSVVELLRRIEAADYPALILDDEADQASPDANVRRRSRTDEDVSPTRIHERILDLRNELRHHVFVQVTATPFALLLQHADSPSRPRFTYLLTPGEAYRGGEHFFSTNHLQGNNPRPPVVLVPEVEADEIAGDLQTAPAGLERAIAYFLTASAAQVVTDPTVFRSSQNFLCHTSHRQAEHDKLQWLIADFLSRFEDELNPPAGRAADLLAWAHEELKQTLQEAPSLDEIVEDICERLPRRKIRIVNAAGKSGEEVRGAPNFIIGGNIVGRGLTISNLLVTYYLRKPRISQMDTMLQHARMFGYRATLMPYTRVFLPPSLATRFHDIHVAESDLRELLSESESLDQIPVRVAGELRATRYGVLDTGSVVTIRSGKHLYPVQPDLGMSRATERRIEVLAREAFGQDWDVTEGAGPEFVPIERLVDLVRLFDVGEWDAAALENILLSLGGSGWITYRPMRRQAQRAGPVLLTGAASGDEVADAQRRGEPTFMLFKQDQADPFWSDKRFWYPTLVFPASMPNQIYNDSAE